MTLTALERETKQDGCQRVAGDFKKDIKLFWVFFFFLIIIITRAFKSKHNLVRSHFSFKAKKLIIIVSLFRLSEPDVWNASSSQHARSIPHCFGRNMFDTPRTPDGSESKAQRSAHTPIACRVWKQSTEHTQAIWCLYQCIQGKNMNPTYWVQQQQPLNTDSVHPFKY